MKKRTINLKAMGWIILCKASFVGMMALNKKSELPTFEINFFRSLFVALITAVIIIFNKNLTFRTRDPKLQLLKVSIGAFGMIGYFYGFRHLEMAYATTLDFSQSLILPIFAIFFLKEKIGVRRILSLIVGYIGILVAINPIYKSFNVAEIVMLVAAACGAFAVVCAKKLTARDSPILLMFYSGVATTFFLGIYYSVPWLDAGPQGDWIFPTREHIPFFCSLVGISFIMQYSYLKAYSLADVGFLAPFNYTKFFISSVLSFLLFDETPTAETCIGASLIILSTAYLARKELNTKPQYQYKQDYEDKKVSSNL